VTVGILPAVFGETSMFMRVFTAAVFAAALLVPAATAQNKMITFTIDNETGATIVAVYTGPSTDPNWGPNILRSYVYYGQAVEISINEIYGECYYDFMLEFDDGTTYEEYEVDICVLDGTAWVVE